MTLPRPPESPGPVDRMSIRGEDAQADVFAAFAAGQSPLDLEAAAWLVRQQDGLRAEEHAALDQWLAADPSHAAALQRLAGVWSGLDALPTDRIAALKAGLPTAQEEASITPSTQAEAATLRPVQAAQDPQTQRVPARAPRRRCRFNLGRLAPQMALAAMAFALVGGGWLGWHVWQQQPTYTKTFATARGQQQEVQLPDGSRLRLDTATRAEVALYRQRREVRLAEGQAMFSVQAAAGQPFDVLAGPLRITVVGTRFSVRHTQSGLGGEGGGVAVEVEQGRVRVAPAATGNGAAVHNRQPAPTASVVELTAGQSVGADAQGQLGPVGQRRSGAMAPWREGRVNFENTPLAQALAEFERYGNTGLVARDPAVGALRLNGSFDLNQSATFARALPKVLPVRLKPQDDGGAEIVKTP